MYLAVIQNNWPESRDPYYNGYKGKCAAWVADVYRAAGLGVDGRCCAAADRASHATKAGAIPPGAVIYSGDKYRSSINCDDCGRNAGHEAIYLGVVNGKKLVAGSQYPSYIMTLEQWTSCFGYGGWSFLGNKYTGR